MEDLKIGSVTIKNPIMLAPMAGVTDLPFRILCTEQGCGMVYTEMVSAKAITYKNKNTFALMQSDPGEHPAALQLFGSEPEVMTEAIHMLEDGGTPFEIIDINMGCPVPKVVGNGEGSALMLDPDRAGRMVAAAVKAAKRPVTVKIRKGFDDDHLNAAEIARIAEANGASAVAVHPRTREQYYAGKADWDVIRQVKEAVKIPVIGNGDLWGPEDAKRMLEETGCDGLMLARGARGNPWIFSRTLHYLDSGELLPKPCLQELVDMILRHCSMHIEHKGLYSGIREMRKHVAWYTAGYPGSSKMRQAVNEIETYEALEALLRSWLRDKDPMMRQE